MNDITDTNSPVAEPTAPRKEAENQAGPPGKENFERFADMMNRDLRRAQNEEYAKTAKAHFANGASDSGSAEHEQRGADALNDLGKKHAHEQIMFRASIGKLRSFYDKARESQRAQDRPAEKSPDLERTR